MNMRSTTTMALLVAQAALGIAHVSAHANCRPPHADVTVDPGEVASVPVIPQPHEPATLYYEFGPWVFPPVLRVHEPPAPERRPHEPPLPGGPRDKTRK